MTKTITLEKPVVWFDKRISEVKLREPTGGEYISLGEPGVLVANPDGARYYVEQSSVIGAYLDKCLNVENGSAILSMLSLKDAKRIKDALLGFFIAAASETSPSDATSSSST